MGTTLIVTLCALAAPLSQYHAQVALPPLDIDAIQTEDVQRDLNGDPPRFAIAKPVSISPTGGEVFDGVYVWRGRIDAAGAVNINLGFNAYRMPPGGRLLVRSADGQHVLRPFTDRDNDEHGQLWTPIIPSDSVVIELTLPASRLDDLQLELTQIGHGYRGFKDGGLRSGSCNVDVVCAEGDDWREEIPSVAVISTGGSTFCTGFMVNNTSNDLTPYFMTAQHCGITSSNAPSLVAYWNYENSWCRPPNSPQSGAPGDGSLSQFNTGAVWLFANSATDTTLVRLDDDPDPDFGVSFAGWDATGSPVSSAVAIHHPNTDEKRISFEFQPLTVTSYLDNSVPGNGSHWRVTDWDLGTTEPGSSGSPLFDQNHRIIGQLHGGYASCTSQTSDWYGRISPAFTAGLRTFLDAAQTGALTTNTVSSLVFLVDPPDGFSSSGYPGGPFQPAVATYVLTNNGEYAIDWSVTADSSQPWIEITPAAGALAPQATEMVDVTINQLADELPEGMHTATLLFANLTDHIGDTTRPLSLQVLPAPPDCNSNGVWDFEDIANCQGDPWCGDCDANTVPDGCQPDCDGDGLPDVCDPDVITLFADTFETDLGWTVSSAAGMMGEWERAIPQEVLLNDAMVQPGYDSDDPGDFCYVTDGQAGVPADHDVDGGPTELTSPAFTVTYDFATLEYSYWFFADRSGDWLLTLYSRDAGPWTLLEKHNTSASTWRSHSENLPGPGEYRLKFVIQDAGTPSLTEGLVDAVRVVVPDCNPVVWQDCLLGPTVPCSGECSPYDYDGDYDVDLHDCAMYLRYELSHP